MAFNILDHVQLNAKNRAQCPACMANGKTGINLSVVESGAYKCFRGCTPDDIRAALGAERPGRAAQVAPPPKPSGITSAQVDQAHERLLNSKHALPWLLERGICREAIVHYRLGAARAKVGSGHMPAIAVPIPVTDDRWGQKKRIAPWADGDHPAWSQSGISATVYSTNTPTKPEAVWLCEGEWDAIRLGWAVKHSELADAIHVASFTCGAGNIPPLMEVDRLPNVPIVALYDLDDPGRAGAKKLQDRLKDRVLVATVPAPPSAKDGWDISDALAHGYGIEAINEAAAAAVAWVEPKRANPLRDRLVTNDELMARAADFQDFLIPDLLPSDELIVLAGPPREGKGYLALGMAIGVASGDKFLDRRCTQGTVLYVNLEDSESKIKQRQLRMEAPEGLSIIWIDKFKLSELPYLIEIADEIDDLRLIVIDTLARARDDNNEESSAKLSQILEPIQEYPKRRGICILLVHHTGKLGENIDKLDPFDLIRGSSAIRSTARGALMLVPGKEGHRLLVENGHAEKLDMLIRRDPLTVAWKLCGNWAPVVDMNMKEQILAHITKTGQGTVTEIAHALSFHARSVGTALSRLHAEDKVTKVAGRGGKPAVYLKLINALQRSTTPVEEPNVDTEKNTASLQQITGCAEFPEKVINGAKSDQYVDHFAQTTLPIPSALKSAQDSCPEGNRLFNGGGSTLKSFEASDTEKNNYTPPEVGSKVRYCGQNWQKQKAMGRKHLTVTATTTNDEGHWVTVEHPDLMVAQTIAATEVKLIQS